MNNDAKIDTKREYWVVKSNDLIQKSRFQLSLPEQKAIAYICSMIKPVNASDMAKDTPFQLEYQFDIRDYCMVCGIDYDSGKNYTDIRETLKKLSDRSMYIRLPDKPDEEVLCRWLSKIKLNKKCGKVIVIIDEDLAPYLFDLGQKFTQYRLIKILGMQSSYSIRIYELLKSYQFQKSKTFDIDVLKKLLMVHTIPSYENFKDFRKKVLEIAINEINKLTDIRVSYETIKNGRKVTKIKFRIEEKEPLERYKADCIVTEKLNGKEN